MRRYNPSHLSTPYRSRPTLANFHHRALCYQLEARMSLLFALWHKLNRFNQKVLLGEYYTRLLFHGGYFIGCCSISQIPIHRVYKGSKTPGEEKWRGRKFADGVDQMVSLKTFQIRFQSNCFIA